MTIGTDDARVEWLNLCRFHLRIYLSSLLLLLLASIICQSAYYGSAITDSIILFTAGTNDSLALLGLRCRDGDWISSLDCVSLLSSCHLSILRTKFRVGLNHLDSLLIVITLDVIEATRLIKAVMAADILYITVLLVKMVKLIIKGIHMLRRLMQVRLIVQTIN